MAATVAPRSPARTARDAAAAAWRRSTASGWPIRALQAPPGFTASSCPGPDATGCAARRHRPRPSPRRRRAGGRPDGAQDLSRAQIDREDGRLVRRVLLLARGGRSGRRSWADVGGGAGVAFRSWRAAWTRRACGPRTPRGCSGRAPPVRAPGPSPALGLTAVSSTWRRCSASASACSRSAASRSSAPAVGLGLPSSLASAARTRRAPPRRAGLHLPRLLAPLLLLAPRRLPLGPAPLASFSASARSAASLASRSRRSASCAARSARLRSSASAASWGESGSSCSSRSSMIAVITPAGSAASTTR